MNFSVDKNDVKKIRGIYRALSLFICFILVICLLGLMAFGAKEDFLVVMGISAAFLFMLYVLVPIVFTGYPPKFLMWALGEK